MNDDRPIPILPAFLAAALVAAAVLAAPWLARPDRTFGLEAGESGAARRVILISLDTLRQDHLSLYGYPRPTSPQLERFAERAVVFDNALTPAPYTLPAHMSMFTGLHPRAHGVRFGGHILPQSVVTVTEVLQQAGFSTAGFTDGGLVAGSYGFKQGFDRYEDGRGADFAFGNGFRKHNLPVRDWIRRNQFEKFFLFLHSFDCHGPYRIEDRYREALAGTEPVVPADVARLGDPMEYLRSLSIHKYYELEEYESLAEVVDTYDACVRFVDEQVGVLLADLEQSGLLDDALVIITSDHGEAFLDHDLYMGHGLTLYEEEVRVPLIVKFPGDRFGGQRCSDVVTLMDLYPTIVGAAQLECPPQVQGRDLVEAITGGDADPRVAFGVSPNFAAPGVEGIDGVTNYARRQSLKYVDPPRISLHQLLASHLDRESETAYDLEADELRLNERLIQVPQLYDLATDPRERNNLAAARAREVESIRARLADQELENASLYRALSADALDLDDFPYESEQEIEDLFQQGYVSSTQKREMLERLRLKRQAEQNRSDAKGVAPGATEPVPAGAPAEPPPPAGGD